MKTIYKNDKIIRPFLRWAGGKQRMIHSLLNFVPEKGSYKSYFEPFFGGGSLFFAIQPHKAFISDSNAELMNCYRQVAKHPRIIAEAVRNYAEQDSPDFFYGIRDHSHKKLAMNERAARFIYLNKAAFNGIYRVNKKGHFNVPYGPSPLGPAVPSAENLELVSRLLRRCIILVDDFEKALSTASIGDFVYLDPPYPPRSKTACFNHYSANRFDWSEQLRVAKIFRELSERGCMVMLSNSYQKKIITLFKDYNIFRLDAVRWLGSNGDRYKVHEVLVTNYSINQEKK